MRAYSLDLRERVAAACQQPSRTIGAVAAQFSVSVSFVEKLLQRQRTSGSLAPLPLRGGPAPCLDASSRADLVACLAELVVARGARLLYLPPYSPDFNPIELAFSKLKTVLRTAQARTREALEAVIQDASNWITERDAKNWFDHCGYHVY